MGTEKIRTKAVVRGSLSFGAAGDAGLERAAAGVVATLSGDKFRAADGTIQWGSDIELVRGAANRLDLAAGDSFRIANDGQLQIGEDVVLTRGAANRLDLATGDTLRLLSGILELTSDVVLSRTAANKAAFASGDTLDMSGASLYVPAGTVALGTANLGTANSGQVLVGYNGGTVQFGFVCNGSVFILEATSGGTVTLANAT